MNALVVSKNYEARDAYLGIKPEDYSGGIVRRDFTIEQLQWLLDNGFLDLEEQQNCSPTVGEFMGFMETYPETLAHGYVVSSRRDDVRVSLEGLKGAWSMSIPQQLMDFIELCRCADSFDVSEKGCYSWWD